MAKRSSLRAAAGAAGVLFGLVAGAPATAQDAGSRQVETVKIRIDVEGASLVATLEDSRSVRDFVSQLPLTLTLDDYASTEKVADLPGRLDTSDAPAGVDPAVGDIAYYAPWGNLAIFYRDFGYSRGLVRLGTIEGGLGALERPGAVQATIDVIAE